MPRNRFEGVETEQWKRQTRQREVEIAARDKVGTEPIRVMGGRIRWMGNVSIEERHLFANVHVYTHLVSASCSLCTTLYMRKGLLAQLLKSLRHSKCEK